MSGYQGLVPDSSAAPRRAGFTRTLAALALLLGLAVSAALPAAAAPSLVSSSPANGATGVAVDTTLVFTFSEAMADIFPVASFPPFFVGNFESSPDSLVNSIDCEWSADQKTLSCTLAEDLPANSTITWKFNPSGTALPFTSASMSALPTTSGSFKTGAGTGGGGGGGGGTVPKLVSSTPVNGATGINVSNAVVFVFDIPMTPNPLLGGVLSFKGGVGWSGTGVVASKFTYSWSSDAKTLTCTYGGPLPGNTAITWQLNPAGASDQFKVLSADDIPLAETTGSFTTGAGSSGGGGGCEPDPTPVGWGSYSVTKLSQYTQSSTADPVPAAEDPFAFGATALSPATGGTITAASVTLPGGTRKDLASFGLPGYLMFFDQPATSALLESTYPGGTYTVRFTQTGQSERTIAMSMPVANPPVPKVQNFAEAQAITPTANFTLKWNAFTGASGNDTISLIVREGTNLVFQAPDPCVPRTLANTATEIVIPANTLRTGKLYDATLSFNRLFYLSTNAVPNMTGMGGVQRETEFTLNTGATPLPAAAARFVGWQLLPNGHPQMTFEGTAGRAYSIERMPPNFGSPAWTPAGSATPNAGGVGTFEDAAPGQLPLVYRAVAR